MLMEAIADQFPASDKDFPEVSIVMPCLNEADTLAACISKARRPLNEQKIAGEIIVADNGSTDGSQEGTILLIERTTTSSNCRETLHARKRRFSDEYSCCLSRVTCKHVKDRIS
jgi:cellulose synthase/poly-beta-1,6-N-acetylglucosamine synthase-like glycosyltransferase